MPHVDDGTLHALLDGALRAHEPDRADRVEAHLDTCADCRARLEEAAALRDRASDVLADVDAPLAADTAAGRGTTDRATRPESGPVPDFEDVLARAAGPAGGTDRGDPDERDAALRRRFAWTRGLAWAATIMVALGTGYLVRDLAGPTGVVPRAATTGQSERATESRAAEAVQADEVDEAVDVRAPAGVEAPATRQAENVAKAAQAGGAEVPPAAEAAGAETEVAGAETPETEVADAEPQPSAAAARGEAGALDLAAATRWRPVSVEEAEAEAGPLLVLPGATIATAERADGGRVRTRQRLPDSAEVVVVQERVETVAVEEGAPTRVSGDPTEAAAPAALRDQTGQQQLRLRAVQAMTPTEAVPTLLGLDLDSAAATVDAPVTVTVLRDGRSLTLTAVLPEDVLLALAATAVPRTP